MKTLTFLEGGSLGGIVVMIAGIMIIGALFISLIVTLIVRGIYEFQTKSKFSKKQFLLTMVICLLICGLISGFICGGL